MHGETESYLEEVYRRGVGVRHSKEEATIDNNKLQPAGSQPAYLEVAAAISEIIIYEY